jgi:hypothetical protein
MTTPPQTPRSTDSSVNGLIGVKREGAEEESSGEGKAAKRERVTEDDSKVDEKEAEPMAKKRRIAPELISGLGK